MRQYAGSDFRPCGWPLSVLACLGAALPITARADLPAVIDKVKPSVVIVGSYKANNSPRFRLRGTGFVVGDGNTAVTNAHVLPDSSEDFSDSSMAVQVRGAANALQMRMATVLALDKEHDLAVLRFDGPAVPALTLGDSDAVREGQAVAFMGFPIGGALGFSAVTHRGLISSITAAALADTDRSATQCQSDQKPARGRVRHFSA